MQRAARRRLRCSEHGNSFAKTEIRAIGFLFAVLRRLAPLCLARPNRDVKAT